MRSPPPPVPDMKPDIDRRKACFWGEEGKKEEEDSAWRRAHFAL